MTVTSDIYPQKAKGLAVLPEVAFFGDVPHRARLSQGRSCIGCFGLSSPAGE